jgi:hypothetical protein
MGRKLKLIVLGAMGHMPLAGMAWQVLHYLEGFRRLGHEVYYVEDTSSWPFNPEKNAVTSDNSYTVKYLARLMDWCGLADHWAYRASEKRGRIYGLSQSQFARVFATADALFNVTAATELRQEHLDVPVRVYLETDPVVPQIEIAKGNRMTIELLGTHTHHFTFGERFGAADCKVPIQRFTYRPTRQPIILDWWRTSLDLASNGCFTTVATWKQTGKAIRWKGEVYTWSKHHEFLKFLDLPGKTQHPLELALACDNAAAKRLRSRGWRVIDGFNLSKNIFSYRDYLLRSRGEFTVAKDQNIRLRTGWFSDRSACYLAAGLPVITQDTAFDKVLPVGEGLFAFRTMEEILAAFEAIESNYEKHRRAASAIAEEYFRAEKVLGRMLTDMGLA